jgi:hypothetical protein
MTAGLPTLGADTLQLRTLQSGRAHRQTKTVRRPPARRRIVLRRLLVLGMAVAVCSVTTASAAAEPQLTLREHCPVLEGQQRYGVEWTATGLQPGAIFDYFWNFGGIGGGASDVATQADSNGTIGPVQLSFGQPVKYVRVGVSAIFPSDTPTPPIARLKRPCKHAGTAR